MNDPKTLLEPLGGWLVDTYAKLRNRPFTPHSLTKLQNLVMCRNVAGATTAVEIGSFKGVMTKRLSYFFDKVISVEIDETLYNTAKARCSGRKNIELILGDGEKELERICPRVSKAVIFLDGHFSGGSTGQGDVPEPVLQEVDIVERYKDNFVGVVVDDFRLFGVEPGWPQKSEVIARVESVFRSPEWRVAVLNDQIVAYRPR